MRGQVCSWESAKTIDTPIGPLKVKFEAGADGPTSHQIKLWQKIVGNLSELKLEAYPFVAGWLGGLDPSLTPDDVEPSAILLWDDPIAMPNWSLQFYLPSRFWRFTVTFEEGRAAHTDFDRDA
jgi:hypothetical protein